MTPREIMQLVARYYGIEYDDLRCKRDPKSVSTRQVAMYLVRTMLMLSFPETGREFKRDHTCVMKAMYKVTSTPELTKDAQKIRAMAEGKVAEFCDHCGQRKDRLAAVEDIKAEHARLLRRIEAL